MQVLYLRGPNWCNLLVFNCRFWAGTCKGSILIHTGQRNIVTSLAHRLVTSFWHAAWKPKDDVLSYAYPVTFRTQEIVNPNGMFVLSVRINWLPQRRSRKHYSQARENSRYFATIPLVSPRNDVWETSIEIPYWCRVTTQMQIFSQYETIPRHGISALRRLSDVNMRGHQWWGRQITAVFLG